MWLENIKTSFKTYYKDALVALIMLSVGWVALYRFISPPITLLMATRIISDSGNFSYHYVDFNEISPYIKVCALASEDQNLPFHQGMDFEAISKAMRVNKKGKKIFGASTISQQVAKNAFLFPQRSFLRKGLELYFTILLETIWSKEKILEMYLNIAEMGTLIFGVEAAASSYFRKEAIKLSLKESAAIIAVLPNPRKYSVSAPGAFTANRKNEIVELFYSLDGSHYLRELYVKTDKSLYDFRNYKK